ncbi:MAG: hypothetical protein L6V93_16915 [Clostridiales bacterium]|nr:MAG: hypothetical protein L6V93_16915 [Clostridiales bacterium]
MSLACDKPVETCFCHTFGIDASEPDGDVVCYKADGFFSIWTQKIRKGRKIF